MATVLVRELTARGLTLAMAESCTGGHIADRITTLQLEPIWHSRQEPAYSQSRACKNGASTDANRQISSG